MPIYVKSGGTWREISSDAGSQLYVRDGTSFTNKTITNAYIKDGGSWRTVFTLFDTPASFTDAGAGTTNFNVPANANAIHIRQAVGAGSGGVGGAEYDKAGGESAGAGGASGGYISDRVYTVVGGEQLTAVVGAAGNGSGVGYNTTAGSGGLTSLTGASTGAIFSLAGGVGGSGTGGGVQGPLRSNNASVGGAATQGTSLSTGTTVDGQNITSFTSGPRGTFNSFGNGVAGTNPGNCGGDNCQITGGVGGSSYNGVNNGGAGGVASSSPGGVGNTGAGGGGGGAQNSTTGGNGGAGELVYRFVRIA